MTPDEIRALPAGRALDALVAEKVMGWEETPELDDELLPLYSTDIAAAWTVAENIAEEGMRLTLMDLRQIHISDGPGWWWEIHSDNENRHLYELDGSAPTAPLAICRAALLATMDLHNSKDMP